MWGLGKKDLMLVLGVAGLTAAAIITGGATLGIHICAGAILQVINLSAATVVGSSATGCATVIVIKSNKEQESTKTENKKDE